MSPPIEKNISTFANSLLISKKNSCLSAFIARNPLFIQCLIGDFFSTIGTTSIFKSAYDFLSYSYEYDKYFTEALGKISAKN